VQPPAADYPPDALALVVADRREEADERTAMLAFGQPRAERVPQERKPAPRGAMQKEMKDINISSVPAGMPAPG
jgi:hypothetical protein